jgi:hydroxymethylglutaryl-CoA reductase (NADPH)
MEFTAKPFGDLTLEITDTIRDEGQLPSIPRSEEDNYCQEAIAERHEWLEEQTGVELEHVPEFSFDASMGRGTSRTSSASPRCRSASPAR